MDIEKIRGICNELPSVTEDVKWGNDLCFLVGGKMFCVAYLGTPLTIAFRVREDEFDELSESTGIIPAPYMARNKWIQVQDMNRFSPEEWKHYIHQSYEYKKGKLTKKVLKELGLGE